MPPLKRNRRDSFHEGATVWGPEQRGLRYTKRACVGAIKGLTTTIIAEKFMASYWLKLDVFWGK